MLALLTALVCSEAVHPAATGRVSALEGAAVVRDAAGARELAQNEPLADGAVIETATDTRLELEIEGGTFVRIGADAAIRLDRLGLDAQVTLLSGALASDPGPRARTFVAGSRGEPLLEGRGVVEHGARGDPSRFFSWSDRRNRQADGTARDARVGEWELARSGEWLVVDGRRAWRPFVDVSWRPYRDGEWRDLSWGWTWIPDETWSYVTVHQGRWIRHRTLGWLWFGGDAWSPAWVTWDASARDILAWAPCAPAHIAVLRADPALWIRVDAVRFASRDSFVGRYHAPVRVYGAAHRDIPSDGGHPPEDGRADRGAPDRGDHGDDRRDEDRGNDDGGDDDGSRHEDRGNEDGGCDDDGGDDDTGNDDGGDDDGGNDDDHDDNGHGNDDDHDDDSNPGQGGGNHGTGNGGNDDGNGNDGHDDNGHGNDDDHDDDSNPGHGSGRHGTGDSGGGNRHRGAGLAGPQARAASPLRDGWNAPAPQGRASAPARDGWNARAPQSRASAPARGGWTPLGRGASAGANRTHLSSVRPGSASAPLSRGGTASAPSRKGGNAWPASRVASGSSFAAPRGVRAAARAGGAPSRSALATPRASHAASRSPMAAPRATHGPSRSAMAMPRAAQGARRSAVATPQTAPRGGSPARATSKPSTSRGRRR